MSQQQPAINPAVEVEADEITLKELYQKIVTFIQDLKKNWLIVAFLIASVSGYMLYDAFKTKPTYTATLTFMLNDNKSAGGIGSLLGQFGFGGGNTGADNLDKIIQLARSRKTLQTALFKKITINGKDDFYANHFIREYDLHKRWKEDTTGLKNFLFANANTEKFSRTENAALLSVIDLLIGKKPILGVGFDKLSTILNLNLTTTNETLSINFVRQLYSDLSEYYISRTIEKEQNTYLVLQNKADSIRALMEGREYRAAQLEDAQRGLILATDQVASQRSRRDVNMYQVMYGEALKNLEVAKFSLETKTPYIQEIDVPISPIPATKKSKIIAIILGGMLGFILGSLYTVAKTTYKNISA